MGLNPHGGDHQKPNGSVLDFSVNVHPLGFPSEIPLMVQRELSNLSYYPSIDGLEAATILADDLGIKSNEVILGNGAIELIYLYARVHRNKTVCIIGPTFNEYERAFRKAGTQTFHFNLLEEEGFRFCPDRFDAFLHAHPECDTVVLCHPNNPTGQGILDIPAFLALAGDREILVDESFLEFTDLPSFLPWIHESKVVVLRSMTKFYALAGLRIGYACGAASRVQQLMDHKEPWTINTFALAAVPILVQAKDYQKHVKEWVETEKHFFLQELEKEKDWVVYPGQANFLLVKFPFSLLPIRNRLLQEGIYFRICTDFESLGENYGRFTVRDRSDTMRLLEKMKEAVYET